MFGIQAVMVQSEYADLEPLVPYDVEKVFSEFYIVLEKSKRKYKSNCFVLMRKGKRLTHLEAYRFYRLQMAERNMK